MKTSTIVWIVVIILIILGAWYWWPKPATAPTSATTTTQTTQTTQTTDTSAPNTTAQPDVKAVVTVTPNVKLGAFLVAPNGMTLYKFSSDGNGISNCTGQCAVIWPPYYVAGNAVLNPGTGADKRLATLLRADGTHQLTYDNAPLYYYSKDLKAGDTLGQGIGGVWSVVAP